MLFRAILSFICSFVAFVGTVGVINYSLGFDVKALENNPETAGIYMVARILGSFALGFGASILMRKLVAPKRVTNVYMGEKKEREPLFKAMPSSGFFLFTKTFSLLDENDNEVIKIVRPFFPSLYRTQWKVFDQDEKFLFKAQEDNIILGFLRRYLNLGKWIPLHFQFNKGNGNEFAMFKRRISLRDKYELDCDPKAVDAWLMIATCILLDTGENR